jgi:hypothetical protein
MSRPMRTLVHCLLLLAVLGFFPGSGEAGDISAFLCKARPGEEWADGYGAALGSTWFRLVTFEAEVARIPGELPEAGMTSFTGAALLSPPLPIVTPYAGVGVGLYRQTLGDTRDLGTLKVLVVGAKMTFGLAVIRADYRRIDISGAPLIEIDSRFAAGVGISF